MTSPQFIEFLEDKLEEHTAKVIPEDDVIEAHARRTWEQEQARERCKTILEQIHAEAATVQLPEDLRDRVEAILDEDAALSWDQAVAQAMRDAEQG